MAVRSPAATAPARTKGCCRPVAAPLPGRSAERLAEVHRALADPTRVQIVHILAHATEPVCVCDLVAAFDLGQPTISHHLARLRDAGMVTAFRRGVWAFYRLSTDLDDAARAAIGAIG